MALIDKLKEQEIYELDRKLRKCAQLLMEPYLKPYDDHKTRSDENMYYLAQLKDLDAYFRAFKKLYDLRFPKRGLQEFEESKNAAKELLISTLTQIDPENRTDTILGIMIPIGIYTIMVNHCFNKETVEKREDRKNDESVNFTHHELCRITRSLSGEKDKEKKRFSFQAKLFVMLLKGIDRRYRKQTSDDLQYGFLRKYGQVDLAYRLAWHHEDVVYYEESAQIGIFLRGILLAKSDSDNALDCIIRMYIANEMDNLLTRTGALNELPYDVFWDVRSENALLRWYYESRFTSRAKSRKDEFAEYLERMAQDISYLAQLRKNEDYSTMQSFCESIIEECDEEDNESFEDIYNDLKEKYKITDEDKDMLIDYYLDYGILADAVDLRHSSLMFLKGVIRSLLKKGKLNKQITENYNKLQKVMMVSKHERAAAGQRRILILRMLNAGRKD